MNQPTNNSLKVNFSSYNLVASEFKEIVPQDEWLAVMDNYNVVPAFALEHHQTDIGKDGAAQIGHIAWRAGCWCEMKPTGDHKEFDNQKILFNLELTFLQVFKLNTSVDLEIFQGYVKSNVGLLKSLAQLCSHQLIKDQLKDTPFHAITVPISIDLNLAP